MKDFKTREYIYLLKSFAIFSVVCAHAAVVPEHSSAVIYFVVRLMSSIGTVGVPIFFLISGYLFYDNHYRWKEFLKRKCKGIVVPWLFCETLVWLYVVLRKGGISFKAWFGFLLGVNHSTYYMTILAAFFVVFWHLKKYDKLLIICMVLSVLCNVAYGWKIPYISALNEFAVTIYLNPFLWMIYFVLGMLVKKNDYMYRLAEHSKKYLPIYGILLVVDFSIHYVLEIPWLYYSEFAILNIALQILVVMGGCCLLLNRKCRLFRGFGQYSFSIYLLHELVVGGVVWITSKEVLFCMIWARPFITIAIVFVGIKVVETVVKRQKWMRNIPTILIGIRS